MYLVESFYYHHHKRNIKEYYRDNLRVSGIENPKVWFDNSHKLILTKLEENLLQAEIMYSCFYLENFAFIGIVIHHSSFLEFIFSKKTLPVRTGTGI